MLCNDLKNLNGRCSLSGRHCSERSCIARLQRRSTHHTATARLGFHTVRQMKMCSLPSSACISSTSAACTAALYRLFTPARSSARCSAPSTTAGPASWPTAAPSPPAAPAALPAAPAAASTLEGACGWGPLAGPAEGSAASAASAPVTTSSGSSAAGRGSRKGGKVRATEDNRAGRLQAQRPVKPQQPIS